MLAFLWVATVVVVIVAWFAIVLIGRYPRGMFDFVEGVIRWLKGSETIVPIP